MMGLDYYTGHSSVFFASTFPFQHKCTNKTSRGAGLFHNIIPTKTNTNDLELHLCGTASNQTIEIKRRPGIRCFSLPQCYSQEMQMHIIQKETKSACNYRYFAQ